jgi:restriction system protein
VILDALLKNWQAFALLIAVALVAGAAKAVLRSGRRRRWRRDPTLGRIEPEWRSRAPRLDLKSWSLDLLRALEWKRFELVCAAYFEAIGMRTKVAREGADGGVDIQLYKENDARPSAIAQCKAWKVYDVDVKPVRELYGVMARQGVTQGIFLTTGRFTREARSFPKGNELLLWDGEQLLAKIRDLPPETRAELLRIATEGDFTTPTCASCGIKLVKRSPRDGGESFWGCRNYPRCRMIMKMTD